MLGIIAEYNPFHLGHQYQLQQAKAQSNTNETVVIMSGNFTQRGEPAVFDKYFRAKATLAQGVDLVLELPTVFSLASSGYFCQGSVLSLAHCGIDTLAFGSETASLEPLNQLAEVLANEPEEYRQLLKNHLKAGCSYPKAQELALKQYCNLSFASSDTPNDLLALGYLTTIKKYHLPIQSLAIRRIGSHLTEDSLGFANASAIRQKILQQDLYEQHVPQSTLSLLTQAQADGYRALSLKDFSLAVFVKLRTASLQELCALPDVNEDLAHTLQKASLQTNNLEQLLLQCKSKTYTLTRLRRALCHLLLHITKDDLLEQPPYLRVLGFNETGKQILHRLKKSCAIPIITNAAQWKTLSSPQAKRCFSVDLTATSVYALAQPNAKHARLQEEFSRFPIVWQEESSSPSA